MRVRIFVAVVLAAAGAAVAVAMVSASRDGTAATAVDVPAPTARPAALLGMVGGRERAMLVRVEPGTLRAEPGPRIDLGSGGCASRSVGTACWGVPAWSFSPSRRVLAVARHEQSLVRSLRLVDVQRMRVVGDVPLEGMGVGALAWLRSGSLLAVQEACCGERQQLLTVDPAQRRVTATRALGGTVLALDATAQELVLLLAPAGSIGPARLAVADGGGAVRFVALRGMLAGRAPRPGERDLHSSVQRIPGFALDRGGRRAFVVESGRVVVVDLASLDVAEHRIERSRSLLARLRDWIEPAAQAKGTTGPQRAASWLGRGLLAVTGADEETFTDARGALQMRLRPAGLDLVDTRSWTARTIDPGASGLVRAGGLLLATGESWDSDNDRRSAIGLTAYGLDGRRRFRLLDGRQVWVAWVHGDRAVLGVVARDGRERPLRTVDLRRGAVIATRRDEPPILLTGSAGGWWTAGL
jgi:hypothetical protein